MIDVCCAIILKDAKILAVQRGPESSHPYQWEFPGGKIYPDETAQQCIQREIVEELSVKVTVLSQIESIEFDYGSKQIRLAAFICEIVSGEIFLTEHLAEQWFSFDNWQTIDWSHADRELIIQNQESLRLIVQENMKNG